MSEENIKNPANWLIAQWALMPRAGQVLNQTVLMGWSSTFGYQIEDPRVLQCLTNTYATVDDAIALVQRLNTNDRKKEQLTRWRFAYLEALNDLQSGHQWQHAITRFTPERFVHLEYCATELDLALSTHTTIDAIQQQARHIEELLAKLARDNSVDDEFKTVIHDLLEALRQALAEYMVRGNKGVMDSISLILSNLFRYKDLFDTPQKKHWGTEVRTVISLAADVATITGATALTVGSSISGFLPLF